MIKEIIRILHLIVNVTLFEASALIRLGASMHSSGRSTNLAILPVQSPTPLGDAGAEGSVDAEIREDF